MKDRDFLIWLHERLHTMHGESNFVDYMHKFRAIIKTIPPDQETPNVMSYPEELYDEKRDDRPGNPRDPAR